MRTRKSQSSVFVFGGFIAGFGIGSVVYALLLHKYKTNERKRRKKEKLLRSSSYRTADRGIAIVTGGSRGIGKAACLRLSRNGYRVVVNYRSNETLAQQVVQEIRAEYIVASSSAKSADGKATFAASSPPRAIAIQADVSNEEDVIRLFDLAEQAWASCPEFALGITACVNNAAIIGTKRSLEKSTRKCLDDLFRVNVYGAFYVLREATKRMSTKREGRYKGTGGAIVNVSSGSAFIGRPMTYAMTKGAMNSMTAGTVEECMSHGVRLNTISPGLTRTDMVSEKLIQSCLPTIPMGRAGEPMEIANGIAWLLSDEASYVAGANIRIAGGRRMGSGCQ